MSADDFLGLGLEIAGHSQWRKYKDGPNLERFTKAYGATPLTCKEMWDDLLADMSPQFVVSVDETKKPFQMLVALRFLWKYPTEEDLANFFKIRSEKTIRDYVHHWLPRITRLIVKKVRKQASGMAVTAKDSRRSHLSPSLLLFAIYQLNSSRSGI